MVSDRFTSFKLPPVGPLRIRSLRPSAITRVGFIIRAKSEMIPWMFWWNWARGLPLQAVPVLHRHGRLAEVVVLHRRDSDHLGGLAEGAVEHLPCAGDRLAADIKLFEVA